MDGVYNGKAYQNGMISGENPPFKETPIYSSDSQESWEISSSDPFLPKHLTLVCIYMVNSNLTPLFVSDFHHHFDPGSCGFKAGDQGIQLTLQLLCLVETVGPKELLKWKKRGG